MMRFPETWPQPALSLAGLVLLSVLLLAACGPSPSVSLQVSDASLPVLLGGSASTQVTLTRAGGAAGDVTLDADGAPAWVSVTFAPATLAGGTLVTTMTVATDGDDPAAAASSFLLTVSAVGAGLTASDELNVNVDLLPVSGSVSGLFGAADPGVSVSVDGGAPIAVDSSGRFEGPDVAIPYDLVVFDSVNEWGHLYQGLTVTDLDLMSLNDVAVTRTTTVSGDLSAAVGADQLGIVCLAGVDQVVTGCDQVASGLTAYSVTADWFGPATTAVNITAWVIDVDADGATVDFSATGQTVQNISDGVAALADVALGAAPDALTVNVTITPPPGLPLSDSAVLYHVSEHASVPFPLGTVAAGGATAYSVVLPAVPGASATLVGLAGSGADQMVYGWETAEYATGALDLVMEAAVTSMAPSDAATGVNLTTEFRVNNPSGAAATFLFSGTTTFIVTTDASEATLPDLSGIGLPLPAAANYTWQAVVSPRLVTVNDAAAEGWISELVDLQFMTLGGPAPAVSGGVLTSDTRSFTTE